MRRDKRRQSGTFVVHVQHCENSTWQGEVVWAEQNRTQKFRSALELLKLMDSALESGFQAEGNRAAAEGSEETDSGESKSCSQENREEDTKEANL